ncbi:hypothetical protein [Deinococcus sp.]|uniref:hypothetical protein n=1 Tax=Deinococcus sp. TaxID=47478 RepID=UPI0025B82FCA|nr:hypothetical protein [Deinococcus sp.]
MTTQAPAAEAPAPLTLQDLYAREAACRVAPGYSNGYAEHKRAALAVQLQMAAFRLMPKLSWPGGPYWGAEVATPDIRYALFNLAGAFQLALRLRHDLTARTGITAPPMVGEDLPLTEMVLNGDYKEIHAALLEGREFDAGMLARFQFVHRFNRLAQVCQSSHPSHLPWAFMLEAAPVLHHMGLTVNDLAAAYLEATNPLVPTPEQARAEAEGGIGGVYYPGSGQPLDLEDLTPAEDPNGPEWAAVKTLAGAYRGQCGACGLVQTLAAPKDPEPCPRCACSCYQPYAPKPEDKEPLY